MSTLNPHTAHNPARKAVARFGGTRALYDPSRTGGTYPPIPSWWPSRLIRRAIKSGREFRLPQSWKQFLAVNPKLRQTVKAL